ncbi:4-diphosphocytidyl-2-C-methyl-D-erythritol kinase [Desulfobaculum bizertense DSM 18034]|uniref:4-diphosphocytidyl-2-C-methyl-D-erythritol kinase n=1 Tax=Desulfobaculum bizertense DSM 18034 TaxID=1121442 RepID=A0A1T4VU07_9BACT|nr:4-diphosphocytidyl-2-C-methyl-D-erythritol kinase [Desulfobaculum bizertense DSM 18034]
MNLNLFICGLREDGYHELDSIFLPLPEPHDTLTITREAKPGFRMSSSVKALETMHTTLHSAYDKFCEATGTNPGLRLHLEKGIPSGAGLGGGSSDAAAFLQFLNENAGENALPQERLHRIATAVGADVPFFLMNSPAHASGIGEKLRRVSLDLRGLSLLLLCPPVHVPTNWAYKAWDKAFLAKNHDEKTSESLTCRASTGKCFPCSERLLLNSFESVVFKAYPKLRSLKEELLLSGAASAVMSGSGASLFALFRSYSTASRVAKRLQQAGLSIYLHSFDAGV